MAAQRDALDGDRAGSIAAADDRGGKVLERFREYLRPRDTREWEAGWTLARDMGTAALPSLERLWNEERNPSGRNALLAAISIAAGRASDRFLLRRLERSDDPRERLLALWCLALGPRREHGGEAVRELMQNSTRRSVLRIAACLAGRRYGLVPPESWYGDSDPGLAAAARYCRAKIDDVGLEKWLGRRPRLHHDLVLRGALLGVSDRNDLAPVLETRVREALAGPDSAPILRCAAACAVRAIPADVLFARRGPGFPVANAIPLLAVHPAHRDELSDDLTRAVGATVLSSSERQRAAVSLALEVEPAGFAEAISALPAGVPDVKNAFCLSLARRLLRRPSEVVGFTTLPLPDCAGARWVQLACGLQVPETTFGDARVDRAFAYLRSRRLSPAGAVHVLETSMWVNGWHPGRATWEAELEFMRDLVLAGSEIGRAVGGREPRDEIYFSKGLAAGDSVFEAALLLHNFVSTATRRIPAEHRLR